jgi:hypothetical protein
VVVYLSREIATGYRRYSEALLFLGGGMVCWFCHWGWPKPVAEIYKRALQDLGGDWSPLHFGPAHIVWEDENFDSAQWCLDNFDWDIDYPKAQLAIVKRSLEELAALPQSAWDVEPADFDGNDPQNHPPSVEMEHCAYGRGG